MFVCCDVCLYLPVCPYVCSCVCLPVSVVALHVMGNSQYRVWYLFLTVGVILAFVVTFTSCRQEPPVYHWVSQQCSCLLALPYLTLPAR